MGGLSISFLSASTLMRCQGVIELDSSIYLPGGNVSCSGILSVGSALISKREVCDTAVSGDSSSLLTSIVFIYIV